MTFGKMIVLFMVLGLFVGLVALLIGAFFRKSDKVKSTCEEIAGYSGFVSLLCLCLIATCVL